MLQSQRIVFTNAPMRDLKVIATANDGDVPHEVRWIFFHRKGTVGF